MNSINTLKKTSSKQKHSDYDSEENILKWLLPLILLTVIAWLLIKIWKTEVEKKHSNNSEDKIKQIIRIN